MNITYRNFIPDDIDKIIMFWNENSGWETNLDRTEFNLRFCSSPFGESIMMLAVDDTSNEIVGLCCFIPANLTIKGKNVVCYRPFGAIIKESFRQSFGLKSLLTGNHPILKLYHTGSEIARQKNASLIYLIPDPRWNKLAKVMPFDVRQFSLWSYPLKQYILPPGNMQFEVKSMTATEADIDTLWEHSQKVALCTLTKNAQFYKWKINLRHGLYQLKGVYEKERLIGLFTLHFKHAEHQWLIGDLLTLNNNEKLTLTLQAACYAAQLSLSDISAEQDKSYKVAILATPLIKQKVKAIGFYKDDYNFTLAVQLLDKKNFSKADVAPEHWYISAND